VLLPVYHGPLQEDNRSFGNRFNLNEGLSRTPAVEYFVVKMWDDLDDVGHLSVISSTL
jgi:hypothetical protein